ncbi:MAG: acyl-CoA dehydrogenase family protein [Bradymonadaceae bacterium]|nr:acyl-CoA dehydrogenase family protein [Lujinxingiaceae bacterium]
MDFSISTELQSTLETVRAFVQDELVPLEHEFLHRPFVQLLPALHKKRKHVRELGLFAPHIERSHGGAGFNLLEFALISEQLGQSPLGHFVFNCQAPDAGNMELLLAHASEAQKAEFLAPLLAGELRSCFSMTEPDYPGSNPVWMGTTATRDGDDYVINGRKWFTSSAEGASFAIVMATTNPEAASSHARASMFLVPTDTPGFRIVRNIAVMGEAGSDYASHAEISYEDCRIPAENRIGAEGAGFFLAQERLGPGRIHHCMRWLGICRRAFDLMCQRAATRQITPETTLGDQQIVQSWIAESHAEILAARLMVLHTAWIIETQGTNGARTEISAIKFHVADVLQRVLDRAIQVHGALGITDDTPLAYWYRHERAARIYDGPDEVHKGVVSRRLLKSLQTQGERP